MYFVQVQQKLGYCPQFDALIDQLTGRETLTMFARLRGVVEKQIPAVVDALIRSLLLEEHADKLAQHYRSVESLSSSNGLLSTYCWRQL